MNVLLNNTAKVTSRVAFSVMAIALAVLFLSGIKPALALSGEGAATIADTTGTPGVEPAAAGVTAERAVSDVFTIVLTVGASGIAIDAANPIFTIPTGFTAPQAAPEAALLDVDVDGEWFVVGAGDSCSVNLAGTTNATGQMLSLDVDGACVTTNTITVTYKGTSSTVMTAAPVVIITDDTSGPPDPVAITAPPTITVSDTVAPTATDAPTAAAGAVINDAEEAAGVAVVVPLGTSGAIAGDTLALYLGGSAFPTPLTHVLTGGEITATEYTFTVASGQLGADGAGKSITALVTDAAGNPGTASAALVLSLDTVAPVISAVTPLTGTSNNAARTVGYTFGEAAVADAGTKISFIRTGGTADTQGTHIYLLTGAELTAAAHTIAISVLNADAVSFALTNALVDGAIYTTTIDAKDAAGNASTTITTLLVTYDTTPPATPVSSIAAGTYPRSQNVALTSTGSSSIRYTVNGDAIADCSAGTLFADYVVVSSSQTVKARGCDSAGNISVATMSTAYVITNGTSGGSGGSTYVPPPVVNVISPNGGASYAPGSVVSVSWTSGDGAFAKYNVSYSDNNGATWTVIASNVISTNASWIMPNTATTTAKVKVDGYNSTGSLLASDSSNSVFTITGTGAPAETPVVPETPATPAPVVDPTVSGSYNAADAKNNNPTIKDDKGIVAVPAGTTVYCTAGTLIKGSLSSVYYCGADGKRYVFVNDKAYFTWYSDFTTVKTISDADMAMIPLGGNITYRPGTRMVKIQSDPKVYAISRGGTLRWVSSEAIAVQLFGADWAKMIDDVSDAFFVNYKIGAQI